MKKINLFIGIFMLLLFTACSSTQSLQEYYIDSAENPNFMAFDVPASILNLEEVALSSTQKEAIASLKKLNVLAFKKNDTNGTAYESEKAKVKAILKRSDYTELMKMNTGFGKATIKYLGDEEAIDEVIIYGNDNSKGFGLIRVLGDDMNPALLVQLVQAIQKSDFKGEGFEKFADFFKE